MGEANGGPKKLVIAGTRGYPSYYGGFETAVRNLAPYLAGEGWDVTVYSRSALERSPSVVDDGVKSVRTRGLETKALSTLSYGFTSAVDAIRRKPDVALIMNVANGFWLPLYKLAGIKTVVNVDGIEWHRAKWGKGAKMVFRLGAWLTAKLADELVTDAQEIRNYWLKTFHRDSTFIPYGSTPPLDTTLQKDYDLAKGDYVLVVARFVPENTIHEFLAAAPAIAQKHKIVIVGSSGYGEPIEDTVQKLVNDYSNVHWLGHVSNDALLDQLWSNCGAYFHGHSVGGTNPALVQAMACGAPTLARDTVYNREVLGSAGIFVAPDVKAIEEGVLQILESPELQESFRKEAMHRAEKIYSWATVNRDYASLLDGVTK